MADANRTARRMTRQLKKGKPTTGRRGCSRLLLAVVALAAITGRTATRWLFESDACDEPAAGGGR